MRVVLASASPRRKQLLREIVDCFEIIPATGEEKAEGEPEILVQQLAKAKAREVFFAQGGKDILVLGADTVVCYNQKVLGKPKDEADAKRMLETLSGNTHKVLTGVHIVWEQDGKTREITDYAQTDVTFFKLTNAFIEEYVAGGSPMDKAGAYGIQDGGLVEKIVGSYSNVVGLPVELCKRLFKQIRGEI